MKFLNGKHSFMRLISGGPSTRQTIEQRIPAPCDTIPLGIFDRWRYLCRRMHNPRAGVRCDPPGLRQRWEGLWRAFRPRGELFSARRCQVIHLFRFVG